MKTQRVYCALRPDPLNVIPNTTEYKQQTRRVGAAVSGRRNYSNLERWENSDRQFIKIIEIKIYGVNVDINLFSKWLTQIQ
jgi:hypothetical protein